MTSVPYRLFFLYADDDENNTLMTMKINHPRLTFNA